MFPAEEDPGVFATHRYRPSGQLVRVVPETKTYWFQNGLPQVLVQSVINPEEVKWAFENDLEAV